MRRLRVPVGGRVLSMVVPDADRWRRDGSWVAGVERGAEPPYWTRVWLSAVATARLLTRATDLAGLQVCDIGCGLGVPGIVAASRGAEVSFVDRETGALAFAAWNARNEAPDMAPRTLCLNWATQDLAGRFDVMILADVSYRLLHHGPLLRQIERCLGDGGLVVHADPGREEATAFLVALQQRLRLGTFRRMTSFERQRGEVRLCLAAAGSDALAGWTARFGLPVPEGGGAG